MQVSFTAAEIIDIAQPSEVRGATSDIIQSVGSLKQAIAGDLTFLGNPKYKADVAGTYGSIVLLPLDYEGHPRSNQVFLLVENPSAVLSRVCSRIEQKLWPRPVPGIHPTAWVDASARIADSATIGPLCVVEAGATVGEKSHLQAQVFVGRHAQVGNECWVMPGVIIQNECVLRNRVRLQPGVVIGSDGFGYEFVGGRHEKVPQIGTLTRRLTGRGLAGRSLVKVPRSIILFKSPTMLSSENTVCFAPRLRLPAALRSKIMLFSVAKPRLPVTSRSAGA